MTVNQWTEILWSVLNVRSRTLHDYKRLYRRHLMPVIGHVQLEEVSAITLQQKLLSLPPQTSRHALMLVKTIYREARLYNHTAADPTK